MRFRTAGLLLLCVAPAPAATLCVNPGGTGGCHASVQAAVNVAAPGDDIEIQAGTYTENVVVANIRGLTIRGAGIGTTTIDGQVEVVDGAGLLVRDLTLTGPGNGLAVDHARASVENVAATGNASSGFFVEAGTLDLDRCSASGNGSGVVADDDGRRGARLSIQRCTISDNAFFGVRVSRGNARIDASTISGNGWNAVYSEVIPGKVRIRASTITENGPALFGGGAVFTEGASRIVLQSSIIAGNTGSGDGDDVDVAVNSILVSVGFNLIGDSTGTEDMRGRTDRDLVGVDPLLGPLADNGGPTLTHALEAGSPALGAIVDSRFCRDADQRGVARGSPCDIGAYEAP